MKQSHCSIVPKITARLVPEITAVHFPKITALYVPVYKIQIWTALITILLLTYLKTKAQYQWHMSNLITFIRLNLFVKIDLWAWINEPFVRPNSVKTDQLLLFLEGD